MSTVTKSATMPGIADSTGLSPDSASRDASAPRCFVISDGSPGWLSSASARVSGQRVAVLLSTASDEDATELPEGWELIGGADLVDQAQLRQAFLRFLEDWPARPLLEGRGFGDLFRHSDGYSLWWTGPGIDRNPDAGIFVELRTLWALDQAIQRLPVAKVFIHSKSQELTSVLVSRCDRGKVPYELLPGSAKPRSQWDGRWAWLLKSLRYLATYPARVSIRAAVARVYARTDLGTTERNAQPAIVFTSQFSRCVRVGPDSVSVWFWQALSDRITGVAASARCCHVFRIGREIPGYRAVSFFYHTAWPLLRRIDNAAPPKERYAALGAWLRALPSQLSALWRYARAESNPRFRESFDFAGADISAMYVPRLRDAVAGICEWSQTVGAIVKSLKRVGNVRAMVLYEEMYRPGMLNIAAARVLGIPTVGVQHGMIMPEHLIYTLPAGQVRGAPIPDYFAATSKYVKEVMTSLGAYPEDRIWITGSPRFDELVNNPPDREAARKRLGLALNTRVVLVTTQTAAWFPAAVRAVFDVAKSRSDWFICVKVHPKTRGLSSDGYRELAQDVGATNVACFDDRFDDLLAACDVLISASSTTILEATLLGRQTICVNFSGAPDRYPYVKDGASVPARSQHEMEQALEQVLAANQGGRLEAERRRFLERHAGPSATGGAGALLARRIIEVACPEELGAGAESATASKHKLASAGFGV